MCSPALLVARGYDGAGQKAPSPACRKRPFTTPADRRRPRLDGGRQSCIDEPARGTYVSPRSRARPSVPANSGSAALMNPHTKSLVSVPTAVNSGLRRLNQFQKNGSSQRSAFSGLVPSVLTYKLPFDTFAFRRSMHRQFDALLADFHPRSIDLHTPPGANRPGCRGYLHNLNSAPYICTQVVHRNQPDHALDQCNSRLARCTTKRRQTRHGLSS